MEKVDNNPWMEKYRPQSFEDLILEKENMQIIQNALKIPKEIPNFFFHAYEAGCGKTSTALLIAKELNCDTLILNASNERGIEVIREKVKSFAETLSFDFNIKKTVILNEADGLTSSAQNSLRDIMEHFADNVFFILTANLKSKVIKPIQSRCLNINFNSPPKEEIEGRLAIISAEEELEISNEEINNIIEMFYPDIRQMILTLQEISLGRSKKIIEKEEYLKDVIKELKIGNVNKVIKTLISEQFDFQYFINYLAKIALNNYNSNLSQILLTMERDKNFGLNEKLIILSNLSKISTNLKG